MPPRMVLIDNINAMSDAEIVALGVASRVAKALILGFGGSYRHPSPEIRAIQQSCAHFRKIYQSFMGILGQDASSLEYINDLRQTWEECNDFLYDYDALQHGAAFDHRQPPMQTPSHKIARYVYTQSDIVRFARRIKLQSDIMNTKIDDVVLNTYLDIAPSLEVTQDRKPHTQPTTHPHLKDDHESMLSFHRKLVLLRDYINRIPLSQVFSVLHDLNLDDLDYFWQLLKVRLKGHEISAETEWRGSNTDPDENSLKRFSEKSLKICLNTYRAFRSEAPMPLLRKRVYAKNSEYDNNDSPTDSGATVTILGNETPVRSIDVVIYVDSILIITCLENDSNSSMIQYIPQLPQIYPFTWHSNFWHVRSKTQVTLKEDCTVDETSVHRVLTRYDNVRPQYELLSASNALTFQGAIRDKHLQGTFQVESISSKDGNKTISQVLKIWTDFHGENGTISFSKHKSDAGSPHLEFSITDFASPFETKAGDKSSIRMIFNTAPKSPKLLKPSKESKEPLRRKSIGSPIQQVMSFFTPRRSSVASKPSMNGSVIPDTSISDIKQPTPSSSSQSDIVQPSIPTVDKPLATINKDAKIFIYLEIHFSSLEERRKFQSACRKIHKRSNELDSSPSLRYADQPPLALPSPTPTTLIKEDPVAKARDPDASEFVGHPPNIEEAVRPNIEPISPTLVAPQHDSPPANSSKCHKILASSVDIPRLDLVFRVRGIPDNYSKENTENLLKNLLGLSSTTLITVRSLTMSEFLREKIAVVGFNPIPEIFHDKKRAEWRYFSKNGERVTVDNHFHGLTILYSPNKLDHKLDICAVSGLGGHAFGSFKQRGETWMWILDLLPKEFQSARIMTYGFDTRVDGNNSIQGLHSLGDELRKSLKDLSNLEDANASKETEDTEKPMIPLIFIAHSLGGLIIREAMVSAEEHEHRFIEAVHGALFFGVPNHGMENGALLSVVKDQANQSLITALGKDSDNLRSQGKNFDKVIANQNLDIIYFYEQKLSPQLALDPETGEWKANGKEILMVSTTSATNGNYSRCSRVTFSINRNHSELVKLGKHEEGSKAVLGQLKDMVARAMKRSQGLYFTTPLSEGLSLPRADTNLTQGARVGTGFSDSRGLGLIFKDPTEGDHLIEGDGPKVNWMKGGVEADSEEPENIYDAD